jgi:hypothetical protein
MKSKRNKMKKTRYLIRIGLLLFGAAVISQSCTKLDEKLYSQVLPSNFFKTDQQFVAALGSAYSQLGGYATGDINEVQEMTTDEVVVPTRGSDWDDGGTQRRLHLHSWGFDDAFMNNPWDFCYSGVSTTNRLIYQFNTLSDAAHKDIAAQYVAELVTLRSFFYWQLVDLYGNVPYDNDFANALAAPPQVARATVFTNVINDVEGSLPLLARKVDGSTYGRMNYYAARFLLAKLFLNSKVYSGAEQLDSVIVNCDKIINSGLYSLEPNYFTNFNVNNSASSEFIFAIPYDKIFFTGFNMNAASLHYGSQFTYNLTFQPWNGYCSLEKFYNSYDATDLRRGDPGTLTGPAKKRGNFVAGPQYLADHKTRVVDDGADGSDPDGKPLNFGNIGDLVNGQPAPQINELGPQAWRQSGVRIGKWEFELGGTSDMSNDYSVFRYADVLLMKAEALWRKSGNPADAAALALVNQVRSRAGLNGLTSLDGALSFDLTGGTVAGGELFNERGREMFAEHSRRQDLIRFGLWASVNKWVLPHHNTTDVVSAKTDSYLTLYPIPKPKIGS